MSDRDRSSRHSSSRHHSSSSKHKKLRAARDSIYKMVGGGYNMGGNPLDLGDVEKPSNDCDAKTRAFASLA